MKRWVGACWRLLTNDFVHKTSNDQLRMKISLTNARSFPVLQLNPNYQIKQFQPNDESQWVELLNKSNEFGIWDEAILHKRIIDHLVQEGGIFSKYEDKIVGCASACYLQQYKPNSILMYVVVLPEHRNLGIGKYITVKALEAARNAGYKSMILHTDDFRLVAINTYLKLGFIPDLKTFDDAQNRWKIILNELGWTTSLHKLKQL